MTNFLIRKPADTVMAHTKLVPEQTPMLCVCPMNWKFDLQNKHLRLNAVYQGAVQSLLTKLIPYIVLID